MTRDDAMIEAQKVLLVAERNGWGGIFVDADVLAALGLPTREDKGGRKYVRCDALRDAMSMVKKTPDAS